MSYFIFNLNNTQYAIEAASITEDAEILYQGTQADLAAKGFNDSHLGGFELVNNQLSFNQEKKDAYDLAQTEAAKPIASGKNLNKFIEDYKSELPLALVLDLLGKIAPFLRLMEQGRCNPLSEAVLEESLLLLDQLSLSPQEKAVINTVVSEWEKTVRFV